MGAELIVNVPEKEAEAVEEDGLGEEGTDEGLDLWVTGTLEEVTGTEDKDSGEGTVGNLMKDGIFVDDVSGGDGDGGGGEEEGKGEAVSTFGFCFEGDPDEDASGVDHGEFIEELGLVGEGHVEEPGSEADGAKASVS